MNLKSKKVIITGASGGIGSALARELIIAHGCRVLALSRNTEKLAELKNELGDNFIYKSFDVTNDNDLLWLKNHVKSVDILVNNAGILPQFKKTISYSTDQIKQAFDVNFIAAAKMTSALLPLIKKSPNGAVINMSSADAFCPIVGTSVYSATKAAIFAYTEVLADENPDILVSTVFPGFCKTNLFSANSFGRQDDLVKYLAIKPQLLSQRIIKGIENEKRRIIIGADAYLMKYSYALFGSVATGLIRDIMKNAKIELFENVFSL
ncbi:MAG: SDR family NAD(P)-dependent oxidoreductase [Clostridia bacterium]